MSLTTTAIYLFIGFEAQRNRTPGKAVPESNGGFMDIPDACEDMAQLVEDWYNTASQEPDFECIGCFDYEITETMGCWLYSNFESTAEEFTAELVRLVAQWRF